MANTTVYPEGSKTGVTLSDTHHLATGGEASVYLKDNRVYKLYTEPQKAIARGMDRKLVLLRRLKHPGIAAPDGLVLDKAGALIGLTLPFVAGDPLCKLFTNTWRDANRFGAAETGKLVDRMREVVQAAHGAGATMVDANELNWIADGTRPVAIDVDSWQLPGFPATVVMPSIMDHGCPGRFDQHTDWFAWAIVSFQLFTGIHPYKGTHPAFGRGNLEQRMKARASLFDAGVKMPPAARDLADIPPRLLAWYERTFQSTERTVPPRAADSAVAPQAVPKLRVLQTSAGTLKLALLGPVGGSVAAAVNGFLVLRHRDNSLALWDAVDRKDVSLAGTPAAALRRVLEGQGAVLRRPAATLLLDVDEQGGKRVLRATDLGSGARASLEITGSRMWQAHNRAFVLVDGDLNGMHEVDAVHIGAPGVERLVVGVGHRWAVNTLSSAFLHNVVVQDAFGTPIAVVVTADGVQQATCPQLRGHRVIDGFAADAHNIWLSVRRVKDGESLRVRLSIQGAHAVIDHEEIVAETDIVAAVTSAGVAVLRMGDELLATKGAARRTVPCTGLSPTLRLFGAGPSILGFDGSQVARLSLN
jgi:hypothetical protein